jgi:hypothetical protein
MELVIDFPGGAKVDAHFGSYTVKTDQPPAGGGDGSAPTPFGVFLASIGACAGIYVSAVSAACPRKDCELCSGCTQTPAREWWAKLTWRSRRRPRFQKSTCLR